jgi:hypothetical protein
MFFEGAHVIVVELLDRVALDEAMLMAVTIGMYTPMAEDM